MQFLGKLAYDAYSASTGGRSLISGDKLPEFEALPAKIQSAWEASASAVKAELEAQCKCGKHTI